MGVNKSNYTTLINYIISICSNLYFQIKSRFTERRILLDDLCVDKLRMRRILDGIAENKRQLLLLEQAETALAVAQARTRLEEKRKLVRPLPLDDDDDHAAHQRPDENQAKRACVAAPLSTADLPSPSPPPAFGLSSAADYGIPGLDVRTPPPPPQSLPVPCNTSADCGIPGLDLHTPSPNVSGYCASVGAFGAPSLPFVTPPSASGSDNTATWLAGIDFEQVKRTTPSPPATPLDVAQLFHSLMKANLIITPPPSISSGSLSPSPPPSSASSSANSSAKSSAKSSGKSAASSASSRQSDNMRAARPLSTARPRTIAIASKSKANLADAASLRVRNPALIKALYSGLQCSNCCRRFDTKQATEYQKHLDEHFAENRNARAARSEPTAEQWYASAADWVKIQPRVHQSDANEPQPSWFDMQEASQQRATIAKPTINCVAGDDKQCVLCSDPLDLFFDDDQEEWMLRDAVRIDGNVYHPACHADMAK